MNKPTLCTVKGCPFHGRYCRVHSREAIKPLPTIKKESEGMKQALKQYRLIARKFITEHPRCQVAGCNHVSEEIHHKAGRIGENLMNRKFFLAVCSDHHRQITDDPAWAEANGYSVSRLKKVNA